MLEIDPRSLRMVAWVAQFYLFLAGVVIYGLWKRKLATVVVVEQQIDGSSEMGPPDPEKLAPVGAAATDTETEEPAQTALPKSLMIWAVLILPINLAAWYLTNLAWIAAVFSKIERWQIIFLTWFTVSPVMAVLNIIVCGFFLSLKSTRAEPRKAEKYRVLLRSGMLDGVLLAPAGAVYVAYLYPERMLGQCFPMVWGAAYASQSLVWAYFFQLSRRESQARSTARVTV